MCAPWKHILSLTTAGPGDKELQQPPLCWTARFWVTPNTEFVLFILSKWVFSVLSFVHGTSAHCRSFAERSQTWNFSSESLPEEEKKNYLGASQPWASCLFSYGKGRGSEAHAEVKQNLKHYPSWAESIGNLGLKTLCGCLQKAKCHVQVTVRICSAMKTLWKCGCLFVLKASQNA